MVLLRRFKIKQYAEEGILPSNIKEYEDPGIKSGICPFCDEPHDYVNRHTSSAAIFYVCNPCEADLESERLSSKKSKITTTFSRIMAYTETGDLGLGVRYAMILDKGNCFFCKKAIGGLNRERYGMSLPVPVHDDFNGGSVDICDTCAEDIDYTPYKYKHYDTCVSCGNEYPISDYEHTYRFATDNYRIGQYLCPSCVIEIHGSKYGDGNRFVHRACTNCKRTKTFDTHLIFNPDAIPKKIDFVCAQCTDPMHNSRLVVVTPGESTTFLYYAILEKGAHHGNMYRIIVFKAKAPGAYLGAIVLESGEFIYPNVFKAASAALDKLKVCRDPKQKLIEF